VGGHGFFEPVDPAWPSVVVRRSAVRRVDKIEDFLVITASLGEFTIVVSEGDLGVASHRILDGLVRLEESTTMRERIVDQLIETVAAEQEKPMIGTLRAQPEIFCFGVVRRELVRFKKNRSSSHRNVPIDQQWVLLGFFGQPLLL
jgi:hypothetical protein